MVGARVEAADVEGFLYPEVVFEAAFLLVHRGADDVRAFYGSLATFHMLCEP